jgi:hypothetical protein
MHRSIFLAFAAALAVVAAGAAQAAEPGSQAPPTQAERAMPFAATPVSDARLMRMRGGFDLGHGLLAQFGISRLVYINGDLVAQSRVQIPDMAHVSGAQLKTLAAALGRVNIIRNGPGNAIAPAADSQALGATVIQNALDNQHIRTLTIIDATVKDLDAFHRINLGNALQSGVINAQTH